MIYLPIVEFTEVTKTGSEISCKSLLIKRLKDETCCKAVMNECWDLWVTTFVSHITRYITYWNLLKNSYISNCKTCGSHSCCRTGIAHWVLIYINNGLADNSWYLKGSKIPTPKPLLVPTALHSTELHIHRGSDQAWWELLWLVYQDSRTGQVTKFSGCDLCLYTWLNRQLFVRQNRD